jgi:CRP-like cAMP-binding protein
MIRQEPGKGEEVLGRLGPGACFGEMALVNDNPRMATARTVDRVNVMAVDRDAFNALFGSHPPLRLMFQDLIAQRQKGRTEPSQSGPVRDETPPQARATTI